MKYVIIGLGVINVCINIYVHNISAAVGWGVASMWMIADLNRER